MITPEKSANFRKNQRFRTGLIALYFITLTWLLRTMLNSRSTMKVVDLSVLYTPGVGVLAYYQIIALLSFAVAMVFAANIWLPTEESLVPTGKQLHRLCYAMVAALCFTAGIAGYAYQTMKTSVKISAAGVTLFEGNRSYSVPWDGLNMMVVDLAKGNQLMVIGDEKNNLTVDLLFFPREDRASMIREVSRLANLTRSSKSTKEVLYYRRLSEPISQPQ